VHKKKSTNGAVLKKQLANGETLLTSGSFNSEHDKSLLKFGDESHENDGSYKEKITPNVDSRYIRGAERGGHDFNGVDGGYQNINGVDGGEQANNGGYMGGGIIGVDGGDRDFTGSDWGQQDISGGDMGEQGINEVNGEDGDDGGRQDNIRENQSSRFEELDRWEGIGKGSRNEARERFIDEKRVECLREQNCVEGRGDRGQLHEEEVVELYHQAEVHENQCVDQGSGKQANRKEEQEDCESEDGDMLLGAGLSIMSELPGLPQFSDEDVERTLSVLYESSVGTSNLRVIPSSGPQGCSDPSTSGVYSRLRIRKASSNKSSGGTVAPETRIKRSIQSRNSGSSVAFESQIKSSRNRRGSMSAPEGRLKRSSRSICSEGPAAVVGRVLNSSRVAPVPALSCINCREVFKRRFVFTIITFLERFCFYCIICMHNLYNIT